MIAQIFRIDPFTEKSSCLRKQDDHVCEENLCCILCGGFSYVIFLILIGLQNFTKLNTLLVIVYTSPKTVLKRSKISD